MGIEKLKMKLRNLTSLGGQNRGLEQTTDILKDSSEACGDIIA